jgi:hypothetical protein
MTDDESNAGATRPAYVMVPHLDDLITADEYADHEQGRLVRLRITTGDDGVEILGDAFRPEILEALLAALGAAVVEQMLCG